MKKKIILLLMLFSSFIGYSQTNDNYTIAILGDKVMPETDSLVIQLKNEISSVVGQSANIVFNDHLILVNNLDQTKAKENYEAMLKNEEVDLILSFGSLSNFVIAKNEVFPKPVILFGVINDDFITFPLGQTSSDIHNLSYILTPQSYKRDLEEFRDLYPYKRVGFVVDKYLTNFYPVKRTLDNIFKEIDAEYELIAIESPADLNGKLENVDVVYLTGGIFFSKQEQQKMVDMINEKNLPSFTSVDERFSKLGVLVTSQPVNNLDQFFRRIALNIEAAVNGEELANLPIYMDINSKLELNIETAFKINFPLKYSFLIRTNIVGDADKLSFQKRYTLKDVTNQVLEQNLGLKSEKESTKLAEQEVKLAKSEYLPELSTSVSGTHIDPDLAKVSNGSNPEFSTSGNINVNQVIYSQQASSNIKIQKELANASQESYNSAEKDAILNAGSAYYNALIAKANYLINNENLRVTRKNFEIAEQKYAAGQTSKSDVLRWRSELARSTQNVVGAYTNLIQSYNELNLILNNPSDLKIDVIDEPLMNDQREDQGFFNILDDPKLREKFINYLEKFAIENAHELKSLQYNLAANKRTEQLYQRSKFLPTVGLQGQYTRTFTRDGEGSSYPQGFAGTPDGYYNVGVQLSLPIFQKNQRNINRQKAFIQREQLNIQKEQTEDNIRKNINDIVLSILNLYSNIELSKISTEAARESLELMQVSYSNGAIGITSLIDAQQAYFQAQQQQANADYNFQFSTLQLERIISYFFILHSEEENDVFINGLTNELMLDNQ